MYFFVKFAVLADFFNRSNNFILTLTHKDYYETSTAIDLYNVFLLSNEAHLLEATSAVAAAPFQGTQL